MRFPGLLPAVLLLVWPMLALAQQDSSEQKRWLALFEQSYGTEGLYVLEVYPADPGGESRLNIQLLNAAAQRFKTENPDAEISFAALRRNDLLPEMRPVGEGETFQWDAEAGTFVSSLGAGHSAGFGAARLMRGNEVIRQRVVKPGKFVRGRWGKIYTDPQVPRTIKREIELREFLLKYFHNPEAEAAEQISQLMKKVDDAVQMYAINEQIEPGTEITWSDLDESGFADIIPRFPEGTEVRLGKSNEHAVAIYKEMEITSDPASVGEVRHKRAEEAWNEYPDYPPALALRARFEDPKTGVELLNEAVKKWPTVAGLRVERMTQHARMGEYEAWDEDLQYVLERFPAAPLLTEIQLLADVAGMSEVPEAQAAFATMLADVRPDLLTQQLFAIKTLTDAGRIDDARAVYDRMVYANPGWAQVLTRPEGENAEVNPEEPIEEAP